jgi:hypothetical protein
MTGRSRRMPESPNRQRLAELMEERRKDLHLRWQDVAERSGLSLKTLHSVRSSDKRVAELTKTSIEDGLRWEHGSIDLVLAGGEPVPGDPPPPALTPEALLDSAPPPRAIIEFAREYGIDPDDPDDPFLLSVRQDVAEATVRHGVGATGGQIFRGEPWSHAEARTWDNPRIGRRSKELLIATTRAERAQYEGSRQGRTGRAGLVALVTSGGP